MVFGGVVAFASSSPQVARWSVLAGGGQRWPRRGTPGGGALQSA
jgi:hypothetical protein